MQFPRASERANKRARKSTPSRALADPFFVVKFHANLFNGSLAIANKRGDELFAGGIYTCVSTCAYTYIRIRSRKCARISPDHADTFVARAFARSLGRLCVQRAAFVSHSGEKYKINIVSGLGFSLSPSFSSLGTFCRDNRAILNRHEGGIIFSRAAPGDRPTDRPPRSS